MEPEDLTFIARDGRTRTGAQFLVIMQNVEIRVRSMVGPSPDFIVEAQMISFLEAKAKAEFYLKVMLVICEAFNDGLIDRKEGYRAGCEYDAKMQDEIVLMVTIGDLIVDMQTWHKAPGMSYRQGPTHWYASGTLDTTT